MEIRAIPEIAFLECFRQWKHRCKKCTNQSREYFEGDKSQLLVRKLNK